MDYFEKNIPLDNFFCTSNRLAENWRDEDKEKANYTLFSFKK